MGSVPLHVSRERQRAGAGMASFPHAGFLAGDLFVLAGFALLAYAVKHHPGPLPGDVAGEVGVQHLLLPHHLLAQIVEAVSTLNWQVPAIIILAVVTVGFLYLRRWLDVLVLIPLAAVNDESSYLLNQWFARPRPHGHGIRVLDHIQHFYSFPSGHVVHAVAVFGFLFYLSTQIRHAVHPAVLWPVRVLLLTAIVLMPVSRVLEGEHWPSDDLGGALFGAFWLLFASHLYLWARSRWPRLLARDERGH